MAQHVARPLFRGGSSGLSTEECCNMLIVASWTTLRSSSSHSVVSSSVKMVRKCLGAKPVYDEQWCPFGIAYHGIDMRVNLSEEEFSHNSLHCIHLLDDPYQCFSGGSRP